MLLEYRYIYQVLVACTPITNLARVAGSCVVPRTHHSLTPTENKYCASLWCASSTKQHIVILCSQYRLLVMQTKSHSIDLLYQILWVECTHT